MNLSELQDHQPVRYRVGLHGRNSIEWRDWRDGELFLFRRETDLPKSMWRKSRSPRAGDILTIGVRVPSLPEFCGADYQGDGVFNNEDWNLQIKDLT
jgi:hypothetical protein